MALISDSSLLVLKSLAIYSVSPSATLQAITSTRTIPSSRFQSLVPWAKETTTSRPKKLTKVIYQNLSRFSGGVENHRKNFNFSAFKDGNNLTCGTYISDHMPLVDNLHCQHHQFLFYSPWQIGNIY